jgi:hypothetical protein
MRPRYITGAALLILSLLSAQAQDIVPAPIIPPATRLEAIQSQVGVVIIKAFTRVGTINDPGGSVEVVSMEVTDATNGIKQRGIAVQVEEHGQVEQSNRSYRSYIDYDEIDPLIKAIDAISKVGTNITTQANFEAKYSTRGAFTVGTFNEAALIDVMIGSGLIGRARVHFKFIELEKLKGLLLAAQSRLEAPK